jgi:choline dehydrogenase-like flavoprotein
MNTDFDVLIVGSGAGGGMAALRLCEQGFKVGVIERGPRFDPSTDYILNYSDWEHRQDPLDKAPNKEDSIDRSYASSFEARGKQRTRSPLKYLRVQGVGGSTLHYQGEAHRFAEHAFNTHSQFSYSVDWPISYKDLRKYYRQAEQLLGVAGDPNNPFKVPRGDYPTPAHPLSARSQVLAAAAAKAGFELLSNPLALPSRSIDGRLACQHSGGCNYGCVFKAKSSVDQAVIPLAEATGNLSLMTETKALRLALNDNGAIQSIQCASGAGTVSFTAKRYILSAGAVETPRLMLASATDSAPNGYANTHDQVGRYFMETLMAMANLRLNTSLKTYSGPPIDARVWDFNRPIDNKTSGFVLGNAGYLYPRTGPSSHALRRQGIGRAHKQLVRDTFGQNLLVFGIAEQEPQVSNRITLSDQTDQHGLAKVKVHSRYSARDLHTLDVIKGKLIDWVAAEPSMTISSRTDTRVVSSATHVGGTCRMGAKPEQSVVDAFGKVHGHSNAYICDASVLPTQGMGDSPSLTIQALALRSADKIVEELRSL